MASFEVVHEKALRSAGFHLRERGEDRFQIAVREPFGGFSKPEDYPQSVDIVTFKLEGSKLVPAGTLSTLLYRDWIRRHKDTPNEAFEFPCGVANGNR